MTPRDLLAVLQFHDRTPVLCQTRLLVDRHGTRGNMWLVRDAQAFWEARDPSRAKWWEECVPVVEHHEMPPFEAWLVTIAPAPTP